MPKPAPTPALVPQPLAQQPKTDDFAPLGLKLSNIDENVLDKYHLPQQSKGIAVAAVLPDSDAEKKGLKPGNIIIKIDKKTSLTLKTPATVSPMPF